MPNQGSRNRLRPLASASLVLFAAACSGETINLGENTSELETPVDGCPPPGEVLIANQAELDALAGCEVIAGSLRIAPFDGADLSSLASLREVKEQLEIGSLSAALRDADPLSTEPSQAFQTFIELLDARWLSSLAGLEALERVGNLSLAGFSVDSLSPLSNLALLTREGGLSLTDCSGFRDLAGLENLAGLEAVEFNCDGLESLRGLTFPPVLETVVLNAPRLADLGGFAALSVDTLVVSGTALENVDALASLLNVDGLDLSGNRALRNVDALDGLGTAEFINISNNAVLERLPELESLSSIRTLLVTDNPALENVPTFPQFQRDFITLSELFEIAPRQLRTFSPEAIEIVNNTSLQRVVLSEGWQGAGLLTIRNNAALESIAFSGVKAVDLLTIADNPALDGIDLGALASVDNLRVSNNPALDLATFDGVLTFTSELSSGPAARP